MYLSRPELSDLVGEGGEEAEEHEARERKKWMEKIERIEKGDDFLTFTPKSEQELFAESQLMKRVHDLKKPHVADDAWRSGFMPAGALVQEKASGTYFFVVRAYWCAVLLWAAEQKEINMFVRDPTASSLEWRVVLDFAAWDVCSVSILSPLHCVLKDFPHWFFPRLGHSFCVLYSMGACLTVFCMFHQAPGSQPGRDSQCSRPMWTNAAFFSNPLFSAYMGQLRGGDGRVARGGPNQIADSTTEDYTDRPAVRAIATGERKTILRECADRGFAFVSEEACISLLEDAEGAKVPKEDPKGYDRKVELAMACLKHVRKDIEDIDAMKILNHGYLLENPECFGDIQIPSDVLADFLTAPEAKLVKAHELNLEKKVVERKWKATSRKELVHKYFKKSASSLEQEKKGKKTRPPKFFPAKNSKTKVATAWLLKHMPPTVSLKEDDLNARWYVINHAGGKSPSISWTRRGYASACSLVLHTAWTFEWESNALAPPFDMDELLKDIGTDAWE